MEKTDKNGVTWDEISQNERRFLRSQISQYRNPVRLVRDWLEARTATKSAEVIHKKAGARLHLVTAELALRCYKFDRGRRPSRLEELVPNYLSSVPVDPFSDRPLVYRPQGTNWLLYSLGTDKLDDGGKPVGRGMSSKGDLFFDSPW